jgi:hypothetical protein
MFALLTWGRARIEAGLTKKSLFRFLRGRDILYAPKTSSAGRSMRYKLRSVEVLSVAKLFALLHGCIGLIFLPVLLLAGVVSLVAGTKEGAIGGVAMIVLSVLMPLFYAGMGFLMGALMSWLYNVLANKFGAIELRLDVVASTAVPGPVV